MELVVERGRGYVSAAQNKNRTPEIGRIPVDSIYPRCSRSPTRSRPPASSSAPVRPPDPRRRDGPIDDPARRDGVRRQDPGRAVRPGPRAERRRRGRRDRPVAGRRADLAADLRCRFGRGAEAVCPQLQLPLQARGIHTVPSWFPRSSRTLLDIRNFGLEVHRRVPGAVAGLGLSLGDSARLRPVQAIQLLRTTTTLTSATSTGSVIENHWWKTPSCRSQPRVPGSRAPAHQRDHPAQPPASSSSTGASPPLRPRRSASSCWPSGCDAKAQRGDLHDRGRPVLDRHHATRASCTSCSPRSPRSSADREGGYTRITKIGSRRRQRPDGRHRDRHRDGSRSPARIRPSVKGASAWLRRPTSCRKKAPGSGPSRRRPPGGISRSRRCPRVGAPRPRPRTRPLRLRQPHRPVGGCAFRSLLADPPSLRPPSAVTNVA